MTRHDIPEGLEVPHLDVLHLGFYHHWTTCRHVVLTDTCNKPVKTNNFGHETKWTERVNQGPCPICADVRRRTAAAAVGKQIKEPDIRSHTLFTTTLNMRCMHMTFREGGAHGEDPICINSRNLISTYNNAVKGDGWCELCDLVKNPNPRPM